MIAENGAFLSIRIDWLPKQMSLEDLRVWVYVSRYRRTKVGVTRGWSFARSGAGIFAEENVPLIDLANFLVWEEKMCALLS